MAPERKLRVGIDVGGTFTDVVALDAATRRLVAAVKVPTTHSATEGVAAGIVAAIERLLRESGVDSAEIAFIAHSTTQATNALLEGDLARVGVVGLTDGPPWFSRRAMRFAPLPLGSGARFEPVFTFASGPRRRRDARLRRPPCRRKGRSHCCKPQFWRRPPGTRVVRRRLRALVAGRCHQRSRRQHGIRPARADADGRA